MTPISTTPVLELLRALANNRRDLDLARFDQSTIFWMIGCGLGPLHYHVSASSVDVSQTQLLRKTLQASDLAARVLTGVQLDATNEILKAAGSHAASITLLKGISVCCEICPEPHLRTMRDIDLLVEPAALSSIEGLLFDQECRQHSTNPAEFYLTHHRSMPFYHPRRPVCVEVHTALFPVQTTVGHDKVFSTEHVRKNRAAVTVGNNKTFRLRPELQLAYIWPSTSPSLAS